MARPTNQHILDKITETDKSLRSEIGALGNITLQLQADVKILNEYMIGQKAIEGYRSKPNGQSEGINKALVSIVLKFLGVIATVLGILYMVIKELTQ